MWACTTALQIPLYLMGDDDILYSGQPRLALVQTSYPGFHRQFRPLDRPYLMARFGACGVDTDHLDANPHDRHLRPCANSRKRNVGFLEVEALRLERTLFLHLWSML